jgi:hypothetical protein
VSDDAPRRLEINWIQSMAAALAAVTSAVLLSTVGVAGTLIGAALGSLVLTFGNAVYSYYLDTTKEQLSKARSSAATRIGRAQSRVRDASRDAQAGRLGAERELERAGADLASARAVLDDAEQPATSRVDLREMLGRLPWKRIAIAAGASFAVAMLVIVSFELFTGRAVSSYTGGSSADRRTSIPGLGNIVSRGGDRGDQPAPGSGTDTGDGSDPGGTATDSGTGTTPTDQPTTSTEQPAPTQAPQEEPESTPTDDGSLVVPDEETPAPTETTEPEAPPSVVVPEDAEPTP